jgi:hypothetical protein
MISPTFANEKGRGAKGRPAMLSRRSRRTRSEGGDSRDNGSSPDFIPGSATLYAHLRWDGQPDHQSLRRQKLEPELSIVREGVPECLSKINPTSGP